MDQRDRTMEAVTRQVDAMGCMQFEVGIFDATKEKMLIRGWTREQVLQGIAWLKFQNLQGNHIYIRPKGEHPLSLIDDIRRETLNRMKADGIIPGVLLETSPNNFQAWVNHGQKLATVLSTAVAKKLAIDYGGDPSSADWRHFGRLAGFTNCKPKHMQEDGRYPFVVLHRFGGDSYPAREEILRLVRNDLKTRNEIELRRREELQAMPRVGPVLGGRNLKGINDFRNNPAYFGDYHRADLAYATYAIAHGLGTYEIEMALRSRDLGHKGNDARQRDYIERTLHKASEHVKAKGRGIQIDR